eukprot:gene4413-2477_t
MSDPIRCTRESQVVDSLTAALTMRRNELKEGRKKAEHEEANLASRRAELEKGRRAAE